MLVEAESSLTEGVPFEPYYSSGGITIYNADCKKVLPFLGQFDLLLTDPPYGIGEAAGKNKSRGRLAAAKDYGNHDWDDAPPDGWLIEQSACHASDAIVWGGNHLALAGGPCWLVWDKDNGKSDFADCELAWTTLKKAVRKFKWKWNGMLQENAGDKKERRCHPTQKPLALLRWCLSLVPDATTILDPFMGSGTTLLAAKLEGRQAVGIELSEEYCEAAANRLSQGVLF